MSKRIVREVKTGPNGEQIVTETTEYIQEPPHEKTKFVFTASADPSLDGLFSFKRKPRNDVVINVNGPNETTFVTNKAPSAATHKNITYITKEATPPQPIHKNITYITEEAAPPPPTHKNITYITEEAPQRPTVHQDITYITEGQSTSHQPSQQNITYITKKAPQPQQSTTTTTYITKKAPPPQPSTTTTTYITKKAPQPQPSTTTTTYITRSSPQTSTSTTIRGGPLKFNFASNTEDRGHGFWSSYAFAYCGRPNAGDVDLVDEITGEDPPPPPPQPKPQPKPAPPPPPQRTDYKNNYQNGGLRSVNVPSDFKSAPIFGVNELEGDGQMPYIPPTAEVAMTKEDYNILVQIAQKEVNGKIDIKSLTSEESLGVKKVITSVCQSDPNFEINDWMKPRNLVSFLKWVGIIPE